MSKPLFISVSRIKKKAACSLQYAKIYGKKPLPKTSNDGSRLGSICHYLLENLLNLKHKSLVEQMRAAKSIYVNPVIERYIKNRANKEELEINSKNLEKISRFCLVALENDFYCEGGILESAEQEFRIENERPFYKIMGYIDKQSSHGTQKIVWDYKSQKKLFAGEDAENNQQGLMYCLAAKKKDPNCEPEARFIFLQFPNDPIFIFKPSDRVLTGFEYYLEYTYDQIVNFNEERDACSDLAIDKPYIANEFSGPLLCGKTRGPGELKKDGSPKWECFAKWPLDYFIVIDKKTKEVKGSYFTKAEIKLKEGEKIVKEHWTGCPRFNRKPSNGDNEL